MSMLEVTDHGPVQVGHFSGNFFWCWTAACQLAFTVPMALKGITAVTNTRRPYENHRAARFYRNVHRLKRKKGVVQPPAEGEEPWVDRPMGKMNWNTASWLKHADAQGPKGRFGYLPHIPYEHSVWRAYYRNELKRRDWDEMYAGNDPVYPTHL